MAIKYLINPFTDAMDAYAVADDSSPEQTLSLAGNSITISGIGGNSVNLSSILTLENVTTQGATSTSTLSLAGGVVIDATNPSYSAQPSITKVDYFERNWTVDSSLPDFDSSNPYAIPSDQIATVAPTVNGMPWKYQSFHGEPNLATQQVMGIISDQGATNGKFIIGNISMVGGIGEPVWTIGYVDSGDFHYGAQNMYKVGDGTNANGILDPGAGLFKPILQLEPSGTIAAVRSKNTTALQDPAKITHNAGSFFEGFFARDVKPAFRIQGLNDPINIGEGGALIEFGPAGGRETDFHLSRWTKDQINIRANNQNFMNWVNNPTWRRGLVMENGTATYYIGEGHKVQETFTATAGQQTFTVAQSLSGNYSVKDVVINGMFLRDAIWSVSGQDITIPTFEASPGYGVTVDSGDSIRIIITDNNKNAEINVKNLWNTSASRSELTVSGGIIKVSDLINNSGVSAFASGGGIDLVNLTNADSVDYASPSLGFNLGTTNFPSGTQYGQTLTLAGNGDTALQFTGGWLNDRVYYRAGNPENVSGSWGTWYRIASRSWVDSAISTSATSLTAAIDSAETALMAYTDTAVAGVSGGSAWAIDSATSVTVSSNSKTFVKTASQAVTITLPGAPSMGHEVKIIDGDGNAALNNITINGNGKNIMGSSSNLIVDRDAAGLTLVYYDSARGWVLADN